MYFSTIRVSATVLACLSTTQTLTPSLSSYDSTQCFYFISTTYTSTAHATEPTHPSTHTHLLSSQCSQQACRQPPQQSANQSLLCSSHQTMLPSLADSEADSQARGDVLGGLFSFVLLQNQTSHIWGRAVSLV